MAGGDLRQAMAGQPALQAPTPQRGNTRRLLATSQNNGTTGASTQTNNRGAGANSGSLPPPMPPATLNAKLRAMEAEQKDEETLKTLLKRQGETRPASAMTLGNWLSRVGEPIAMVGMAHDEPFVTILTSVVHYAALGSEDELWDGQWMAAADDRSEDGSDPPFVRMKSSYWD